MPVLELKSDSLDTLKRAFEDAFLTIWNAEDSLPFLSYSGQRFTHEQINAWVGVLGETNPIRYLFSEENDEIRGIAVLNVNLVEGFELYGLGVNPACRNAGIGSLLIESSCGYALKQGFRSIKTTVFADNLPMQRLVLKHGFMPVSMDHGKRCDSMAVVNYMKRLESDG